MLRRDALGDESSSRHGLLASAVGSIYRTLCSGSSRSGWSGASAGLAGFADIVAAVLSSDRLRSAAGQPLLALLHPAPSSSWPVAGRPRDLPMTRPFGTGWQPWLSRPEALLSLA